MNLSSNTARQLRIGGLAFSSGSRTNTGLNGAYVHQVSGPAVAVRFQALSVDSIDEAYVFLDSVGGTLGNVTMEARIYSGLDTTNGHRRPGATLHATSTATTVPNAVDKWVKFVFGTPYTPAVGETLWLVVINTSTVQAVDFPNILTATNWIPPDAIVSFTGKVSSQNTTTGFSTDGSAISEMPFVIKCGSYVFGQPFTQTATIYGSNALERGFLFTPPVTMTVQSVEWGTSVSHASVNVLDAATAPGGATIYSWSVDNISDDLGGVTFASAILEGGRQYRCTIRSSASNTSPASLQIEDYASYSSVFDALRDQDPMVFPPSTVDNGAGGWTADKSHSPSLSLMISEILPTGGAFAYVS